MMHVMTPARIADWLATWGYLGIFVCVFIGNLGIPVPEESVMLVAGFCCAHDIMDLRYVYLVVIASAVVGDCCGFMIGRTGGQRVIARLAENFETIRHRYDRLQVFFDTHGSKAVFMARFIAGVRFLAGPMAGACGMPFLRFLGWNVMGAIIWCSLVVTIGYLVGDELDRVAEMAHSAHRWMFAIVMVGIALIFFVWWREKQPAATRPES